MPTPRSKARRAAPSASEHVPAVDSTPSVASAKPKSKHKLVRDSFTIPKDEYVVLDGLKARALGLSQAVKKGELLRAGIAALNAMPDKAFLKALGAVPELKTGRPRRDKAATTAVPGL